MTIASTDVGPTQSQLRYLRLLAQRTETTFVYPTTRAQASREIERLRRRPAPLRVPRIEREPDEEPETYATAVRDHEVRGRGSSAAWRHKPESDEEPLSDRRRLMMGHRVELARYRLSSGERVLCAERIKGSGVCVVDVPAHAGGRRYVVERNVHLDGNAGLRALLDDYIAQAKDCGRVPMATSALDLELEADA
jgi:hypothetical protein